MALLVLLVFSGGRVLAGEIASLGFSLPTGAKYTVTTNQFNEVSDLLKQKFSADTNRLSQLLPTHLICGPGLWQLLKDSPRFSVPPVATTTCKVPIGGGRFKELPAAMFQNDTEVANFCAALADLNSKNGDVVFRLPNENEFKVYWAVVPFDDISEPLIVAEGRNYNLIILFAKGKVFWIDEVKTLMRK